MRQNLSCFRNNPSEVPVSIVQPTPADVVEASAMCSGIDCWEEQRGECQRIGGRFVEWTLHTRIMQPALLELQSNIDNMNL